MKVQTILHLSIIIKITGCWSVRPVSSDLVHTLNVCDTQFTYLFQTSGSLRREKNLGCFLVSSLNKISFQPLIIFSLLELSSSAFQSQKSLDDDEIKDTVITIQIGGSDIVIPDFDIVTNQRAVTGTRDHPRPMSGQHPRESNVIIQDVASRHSRTKQRCI